MNNAEAIPVNKLSYAPGERVTYTLDFCRYEKRVATVYRALVNTYRVAYTPIHSDLPIGCHVMNVSDITIPDFVVPDGHTYYIEATVEYKINPLRTKVYHWRTVNFNIE